MDRHWRALAALHAAEDWLWPLWALRLVGEGWTVEKVTQLVGRAGHVRRPPDWADATRIAYGLQAGFIQPEEVDEMEAMVTAIKDEALRESIMASRPASLADVKRVIKPTAPISLVGEGDETLDVPSADPSPASPQAEDEDKGIGNIVEGGPTKARDQSPGVDALAGTARPVKPGSSLEMRTVDDTGAPDARVLASGDNKEDPSAIPPFLRRHLGADTIKAVEHTEAAEQEGGHPANEPQAGGEPAPGTDVASLPEQTDHEEGAPLVMTPEEPDLDCVIGFLRTPTPPLSPQRVVNVVSVGRHSELAALAQPQHKWLGELLHLLDEATS